MSVSMNKMRDDQDFNIHFVKIIEHERSLYDKSLPEYRSKEEHERIWHKISGEVNESGKIFPKIINLDNWHLKHQLSHPFANAQYYK